MMIAKYISIINPGVLTYIKAATHQIVNTSPT